ncbi:MAG: hypothetical protein ACXAD7_20060 [Candidatus Kariarchaeaceae archaeon]|jgi:hypothetical protein
MLSRQLFLVSILAIILFGGSLVSPETPEKYNITTQSLPEKSGTINGIDWSYGTHEFTESGNITRVYNDTLIEFKDNTEIYTEEIPLITNSTFKDVHYNIEWNFTVDDPIANYTDYNNETFFGLITFVNFTMASRLNNTDLTNGQQMLNLLVIENYTTVITDMVSYDGEKWIFLGRFPSNTTYVEYNHKFANGTILRRSGLIAAKALIYDIEEEIHTVNVEHKEVSLAYMGFYSRYSMAYNVSATAHYVNITDGKNFGSHVTMFDEIEANYTQFALTYVGYEFRNFNFYNLTFEDGTPVDWSMYPKSLLPTSYNKSGVIVEAGFQQVSSKLISTYQSVIAAFAQVNVDPNAITKDDFSIEAKLAVWGIQSTPTMVAYSDGNRNNKLDLSLDDDGLIVDPTDTVAFLGLAEAYHVDVFDARYTSSEYNESVQFHGLGVTIENKEVNETEYYDGWSSFGTLNFDPNAPTSASFVWNTPTEGTDGTVVFDFGIDYINFPVTWVDLNNVTESFIEPTNIGYHYKVTVDPKNGRAKISTTWKFDGITDPTNNARMDRLSLANIVKSEFFALRLAYTATESEEKVNTSRVLSFERLAIAIGGGDATEIDATGPKASYLLDGTTSVSASFNAINLLKVSGHFRAEKVSPFASESETTAGAASVGAFTERLAVDFFYSVNLVIISYPTWNGGAIVHDPDYNVNYEPVVQAEPTTTEPTTTEDTTTSEEPTTTTQPTSSELVTSETKDTDTPEAPGLTLVFTLVGISTITIIRRKK